MTAQCGHWGTAPLGELNPNLLFIEYVRHSYKYYQLDEPTITDAQFDRMCVELLRVFKDVTHPDKHLTDEDALRAGTGFQMMFKWPEWAKE